VEPAHHLPLNPRDYLILLVLSRGERHGYGIIKLAERYSGRQVRLDPANLYRALRRLDRDGLVAVADGDDASPPSDRPARRGYVLTALGSEVVAAEAARLARLTDAARAWRLIPDVGRGQ
jgi:DNA-binding PadR family transcriptional regulator